MEVSKHNNYNNYKDEHRGIVISYDGKRVSVLVISPGCYLGERKMLNWDQIELVKEATA
jgi:hypothetical protein